MNKPCNIRKFTKNYLFDVLFWVAVFGLAGFYASKASADELEFRVTNMTYTWGEHYSFPVTAYQIGFTKYKMQTGFRIMVGQSDTRTNVKGTQHTNQMRNFVVLNIHRKLQLTKSLSFQYGLNYTEYKGGSKGQYNADCDYGHGMAFQYQLSSKIAVKLSYDKYYEKYKQSLGLEETKGAGFSLVGIF